MAIGGNLGDACLMGDNDKHIERHYRLLVEFLLLAAVLTFAAAATFPILLK